MTPRRVDQPECCYANIWKHVAHLNKDTSHFMFVERVLGTSKIQAMQQEGSSYFTCCTSAYKKQCVRTRIGPSAALQK